MIRPAAAAAALTALLACSPKPASGPPAAPAPGAPAPAAASAGTASGPAAYANQPTALRREPTEAARVRGPGGKDTSNVLAVLLRGERVAVLEAREDWARVRSSDDREGWLKRATLLEGDGIVEATVLVPADVFDRPDLLAANARRRIDPGTLLLVVKTRPPFSEVNVSSGPNAWVLSERIATGERDVSTAKLIEKARWLARSGKPDEAKQILALARSSFPGVALVEVLAVELGEPSAVPTTAAPSAPPAVVPASAPAPGSGG
jgi:SH3-like domain-containing protein